MSRVCTFTVWVLMGSHAISQHGRLRGWLFILCVVTDTRALTAGMTIDWRESRHTDVLDPIFFVCRWQHTFQQLHAFTNSNTKPVQAPSLSSSLSQTYTYLRPSCWVVTNVDTITNMANSSQLACPVPFLGQDDYPRMGGCKVKSFVGLTH